MKNLICIVCPRGCHIEVSDAPDFTVIGNACQRGAVYGQKEVQNPERMVTATCPLQLGVESESLSVPRRVPVRTTAGIAKERVGELVEDLQRTIVCLPVQEGDVIIDNWHGTGVSVVATRSIQTP